MLNFQPIPNEILFRELFSRSFYEFVKHSWPIIESASFVDNWHIGAICEHLEAVYKKQIQNLLINIPPRMMKTIIVSVNYPSWVWTMEPSHQFMCTSYSQTLSHVAANKMRTLVTSPWFESIYPGVVQMKNDQDTKQKFENTAGGYRLSTSVSGLGTGEGGDTIIADDPHNADDIYSEAARLSVINYWKTKLSTRLNDKKTGSKIVIMQRLHQDDLSGWILEESTEKFEHLCLPMEYVRSVSVSKIGFQDPRTQEGELLFPARYGEKERDQDKKDMGTLGYSGQMQQSPVPAGGNIIRLQDIKYFKVAPEGFQDHVSTFDMSFEGDITSDYNVGVYVTRLANNYYVHSIMRGQWNFPQAIKQMENYIESLTSKPGIVIEKKANGHAALQILRKKYSGVIAYEPKHSKESRLYEVQPLFEGGNVFFNSNDPNVAEAVKEFLIFPKGKHDDIVDAVVMALIILRNRSTTSRGFESIGKRKYG